MVEPRLSCGQETHGDVAPTSLSEHSCRLATVLVRPLVTGTGDREDQCVPRRRVQGRESCPQDLDELLIGSQGGSDRDPRVVRGLLNEVYVDVIPGRQQQRDDDDRLVRRDRSKGCCHIGLLHINVTQPDRDARQPLSDGIHQSTDGLLALSGGSTVRDREEGWRG